MHKRISKHLWLVTCAVALLALTGLPQPLQADPRVSDLNDDGVVNGLDLFEIIGRLGTRAGEEGYREGLDLAPSDENIIDLNDYLTLIPDFG